MPTTLCRDCKREVSTQAHSCPECGAPHPYQPKWDGYGFEYKSRTTLLGLPLVHIAFKYRPNRVPVVAKGWLAIGQFSYGVVNVSQFGCGPICLSQVALAGAAVAQICGAVLGACQLGIVWEGIGQTVLRLSDYF